MKVFVQGEDKLIPLQGEVTEDSIENALGYTPVSEEDLPDITNDDDTTLYVVDKDGNIITKTDKDGFHASTMTVNGKDVESGLVTEEDRASWGGSDLDDVISKDDDTTLHIVDGSGNVIAKIDKDGLHTTEVELGGEGETKVNVKEHIDNTEIHVTKAEREHWADKSFDSLTDNPISTDDDKAFYLVDKNGNIIFKIDGEGTHASELYIGNLTDGEKTVAEIVTAEANRAKGIEDGLDKKIIAETNRATGAETALDGKITTEKNRAEGVEGNLSDRIDTVEDIAKGAGSAKSYDNYSAMVSALNDEVTASLTQGQNVMIVTRDVPDLWVSTKYATKESYTYADDATIVNGLLKDGKVRVGFYDLSYLETQKVVLTDYVKKNEQTTALNSLKKEMSEQIVSDSKEWHIVDTEGNIIATIDENGVQTTTVTADAVIVNGNDVETMFSSLVEGLKNYTSLDRFTRELTKFIDGTITVAKASTADTLKSEYKYSNASLNASKISVTLTAGRIYAVTFTTATENHTVIIMTVGNGTTKSTAALGDNGAMYGCSYNGAYLNFFNSSGSAVTITACYIREI